MSLNRQTSMSEISETKSDDGKSADESADEELEKNGAEGKNCCSGQ